MKKKIWVLKPILFLLVLLCVALTLLTGFFYTSNRILFYTEACITCLVGVFVLFELRRMQKEIKRFLQEISSSLATAQQDALESFPMPVLVAGISGEIVWYNDVFKKTVLGKGEMFGGKIGEIITNIDMENLAGSEGYEVEFKERLFTVYAMQEIKTTAPLVAFYFMDETRLKRTAQRFEDTRPSVGIIMIDNCEELLQSAEESERAQLVGKIEYLMSQYINGYNGLFKKLERDKYVMVVEEQCLRSMIEKRFDILDKVREVIVGENQVPTTISIGIGHGAETLFDGEQMARQALEMAMGRGGDQVAVHTQDGYEFFGGVSKGVEKRTKVKTRMVASALIELIDASDNVIIMGHQFADLDCLGAATGLLKGVRMLGKPVSVVINKKHNLAQSLYERLLVNGYEDAFLEPSAAMGLVTKKTLLIVVDTHIQRILESEEIYKACKNVVVIDHHRKMVGHIDRAVIFYHEPYASSASEMVTELLQYFGNNRTLGRIEAEALLAGIMLDTRNFVLRTGVRTFEAAAYLRKLGADTVEVRRLFSSSMSSYRRKIQLVSSAEIYMGCAIAKTASETDDIKLVAPQAADELLSINGVDASFVMYEYEGEVSFSARSMGGMNVQLIMEKLGGGGHQTMAGAQMKGISLEDARQILLRSIDEYHRENAAKQQKNANGAAG
ncbi:MAG: DHH family phosphoesterase [Hydrogenoanaerobacterium sp.]